MFDEEEEGGQDTLSMDPDDQIKYQIQEGKIFFKEDDAKRWIAPTEIRKHETQNPKRRLIKTKTIRKHKPSESALIKDN